MNLLIVFIIIVAILIIFIKLKEFKNIKILKQILALSVDGIHIISEDGKLILCSDSFAKMLGYEINEINKLSVFDFDIGLSKEIMYERLKKTADGEVTFETQHTKKDGTIIDVEIYMKGFILDNKRCFFASSRDISDRKRKAEELERINYEFEIAQEIANLGSWVWYINEQKFKGSKETKRLYKYDRDDEVTFETHLNIIHKDDREAVKNRFAEAFNSGIYDSTHRVIINNEIKWMREKAKFIKDKDGDYFKAYGIGQDITELKQNDEKILKLNNELITKSKMAQLGEMLRIIAHQWKQPLSIISSQATVLFYEKEFSGTYSEINVQNFLNEVIKQIEYLSQTIDDFRHFNNPNKKPTLINLKNTIENSLEILEYDIHRFDIKIKKNLNISTSILMNDNEFMQVIINLIKNSKDEFVSKSISNRYVIINGYEDSNYIIVEFIDNGGGIKDNILPHIFDIFFTTKNSQNGTGLGLDLCKTIIENHMNGTIVADNIETEYGFGARFTIKIPKKDS